MNINNYYIILPLRIIQKPEGFQVTICVAVEAPSCTAHPPHSNDNIIKQNSNNALGGWNNQ